MAVVSYTYGFVFVSNPKAASTSVEDALKSYQERADLDLLAREGLYTRRHIPALEMQDLLGDDWAKLYTFGLMRHPHSWLASQLTYNYRRLGLEIPLARKLAPADVLRCFDILKDRRGQAGSRTGSQWAFLCDQRQRPVVSRIIRLEVLSQQWKLLTIRLGITAPFPGLLNTTQHPPGGEWLSPEARELVDELWGDDLALYASLPADGGVGHASRDAYVGR
jgi:hypothetical protein